MRNITDTSRDFKKLSLQTTFCCAVLMFNNCNAFNLKKLAHEMKIHIPYAPCIQCMLILFVFLFSPSLERKTHNRFHTWMSITLKICRRSNTTVSKIYGSVAAANWRTKNWMWWIRRWEVHQLYAPFKYEK